MVSTEGTFDWCAPRWWSRRSADGCPVSLGCLTVQATPPAGSAVSTILPAQVLPCTCPASVSWVPCWCLGSSAAADTVFGQVRARGARRAAVLRGGRHLVPGRRVVGDLHGRAAPHAPDAHHQVRTREGVVCPGCRSRVAHGLCIKLCEMGCSTCSKPVTHLPALQRHITHTSLSCKLCTTCCPAPPVRTTRHLLYALLTGVAAAACRRSALQMCRRQSSTACSWTLPCGRQPCRCALDARLTNSPASGSGSQRAPSTQLAMRHPV